MDKSPIIVYTDYAGLRTYGRGNAGKENNMKLVCEFIGGVMAGKMPLENAEKLTEGATG